MRKKIIIWMCLLTLIAGVIAPTASAKVKLNTKKRTISVGETYKLKVSGTSKKVKWKSSNKKVAKVSKKGVVTGKKTGKATITAKVGKKKLKCKISVTVKFVPGATAAPNSGSDKTNTDSKSSTSSGSDSLLDSKTDTTTTTNDDGWVPGWY